MAEKVERSVKTLPDDLKNVEFETSEDVDVTPAFDSMGLREDLLRGIYAYGPFHGSFNCKINILLYFNRITDFDIILGFLQIKCFIFLRVTILVFEDTFEVRPLHTVILC